MFITRRVSSPEDIEVYSYDSLEKFLKDRPMYTQFLSEGRENLKMNIKIHVLDYPIIEEIYIDPSL